MLRLTDVTWLYQHLPMRFTLSIQQGEQVAVLGPSGAGKSTLLNLIAGFLSPASGVIMIENSDHTRTLGRMPDQLSGGQRQRVALARCLVREQPVLLLDEPFSALDPALRQEMLALVKEVCHRQQLTLLMVSHNVEDAARIASRALVIADGRIAWDGQTDELLSGNAPVSSLLGIR